MSWVVVAASLCDQLRLRVSWINTRIQEEGRRVGWVRYGNVIPVQRVGSAKSVFIPPACPRAPIGYDQGDSRINPGGTESGRMVGSALNGIFTVFHHVFQGARGWTVWTTPWSWIAYFTKRHLGYESMEIMSAL